MVPQIYAASAADMPGIMTVMAAAFAPEYGEAWTQGQCLSMLTLPGSAIFVAELGGRMCGFAFVRTVVDEAELLMIAVAPEFMGRGIGRQILGHVTEYCCDRSIKQIHLEVREGNNPAIKLYENDGFLPIGVRYGYYHGANGQKANSLTFSKAIIS